MKISMLIGSLSGGGAERVVCNLANYLARKKHDVTVITLSNAQSYKLDTAVNRFALCSPKEEANMPKLLRNILRMYRLNRRFRKEDADVFLTFLPVLSRVVLMQKCFIRPPVVLAERCDPQTYCAASEKNKKAFLKYYPRADAYVFQTEDARAYYIEQGIDVRSSCVIPNAINPAFVRAPFGGERSKRIVSAGRLTQQKNFPLLIRAFAQICEKYPDYRLVIYGEGALLENHRALAAELGVADRVEFPGYTTDIADAIQDAALFVLPSDYEGMPNALAEAMALGLPCVATDCPAGGSKYLIQNGENGLLVPVGDVDATAQAMDRVLSDGDFAKSIGSKAAGVQQRLEAGRIYGEWEKFIVKVAGMGGGRNKGE